MRFGSPFLEPSSLLQPVPDELRAFSVPMLIFTPYSTRIPIWISRSSARFATSRRLPLEGRSATLCAYGVSMALADGESSKVSPTSGLPMETSGVPKCIGTRPTALDAGK